MTNSPQQILGYNRYGKAMVRMMKLNKTPVGSGQVRHDVSEVCVKLQLEGNFDESFFSESCATVVPTDTQKNTVFAVAKHWNSGSIEELALMLARHVLVMYDHATGAVVSIEQTNWERIVDERNQGHNHAFVRKDEYTPFVRLHATRVGDSAQMVSGLRGLRLLKTTKSGFVGYPRCKYTTLPETTDRMMRSDVHCEWNYTPEVRRRMDAFVRADMITPRATVAFPSQQERIGRFLEANNSSSHVRNAVKIDFVKLMASASDLCKKRFVGDYKVGTMSWSVQQTMKEIGDDVISAVPEIESIFLSLPNLHVWMYDIGRFGMSNDNEVWTLSDEPHGVIECVVSRTPASKSKQHFDGVFQSRF